MGGACSTHAKLREVRKIFQLENLKGGGHSEDAGVHGEIILKGIFGKQGGKVWTGFIWPRIGTSGGFLWVS
jgi:hypothetical protein